MKANDILWIMEGTRQNDIIEWEATPKVIKEMTETNFRLYKGVGGSIALIGLVYFPTKEECEDHWLKTHTTFVKHIDYDEKTPEGVTERPRTNWDTFEVCKDDFVDSTTVYSGGLSELVNITDKVKWRVNPETEEYLYIKLETLTLKEISEQMPNENILTVIHEGPMYAEIFQYGNYPNSGWVRLGEVMGYA